MGPVGPMGPAGTCGISREPDIVMKEPSREWCNLDMVNVIIKTVLSTSKKVALLKPSEKKSFYHAKSICESICGNLYFPSTLVENNVVRFIAEENGAPEYDIWLRLSDHEEEGVWKDPDNKETLTFTNWANPQPDNFNGYEHFGMFWYSGKWNDVIQSRGASYILCELT